MPATGWLTSCGVSAVILAVIVIMWAVVLVPMWLRRHDAATESRSVDRFSTAMRVLSRRQPGMPDRRYVVMPKREQRASVHVSGASASRRPAARPDAPVRPHGRPSIAVRRRRALLGLAGLTFLTFLLAVGGVMGWVLQLVVDLVLVAFVVHLRTQAKRAAAVSRQRRRVAAAPAAARQMPAAAAVPTASRGAVDERATAPIPAVAEPAPSVAQPVAEPAATGTDDGWQPVPVPRPTYTMKPKAPQRWTYAPPVTESPAEPDAAPTPAAEEQVAGQAAERVEAAAEVSELDGILEHRWAVND